MILVCGEALMDLFPAESAGGRLLVEATPGGSPFNVAIGLSRLGARSAFLGGLSTDAFGRLLRERLLAASVDVGFAVDKRELTTLSIVHRDPEGGVTYAFHGDGKADRAVTEADLPAALPDDCRALTFGSYTLAVGPVADAFLALARREAGRRVISINPNVRPSVTPDMTAWRARFDAMLATADLVKASEEDLRFAFGDGADIDDIAARWAAAGPEIVFVTRGPDGALAVTRDGRRIAVPGRAVEVIDTVGAGDTFHAAVLAELDRRGRLSRAALSALPTSEIEQILAYAVTASSITCSRQGADLPVDAEVRRAASDTAAPASFISDVAAKTSSLGQ